MTYTILRCFCVALVAGCNIGAFAPVAKAQTFKETPLPRLGVAPRADEQAYVNDAGTLALVTRHDLTSNDTLFRTSNGRRGRFSLSGTDEIAVGAHIAFRSWDGEMFRVFTDGVAGRAYDFVGRPHVYAGNHVFYPARRDTHGFVVKDERAIALPGPVIGDDDQIEFASEALQVSSDGRSWLCLVQPEGRDDVALVQNGRALARFESVVAKTFTGALGPSLPQDSSLLQSYGFCASGKRPDGTNGVFWFVNGKYGPTFDGFVQPYDKYLDASFFAGQTGVSGLFTGKRNGKVVSVLWGPLAKTMTAGRSEEKEIKSVTTDWALERVLSPDGKHFAFLGRSAGHLRLEFDGHLGPTLEQSSIDKIAFSPHGNDLAWVATKFSPGSRATSSFWVHGDKQGPSCDEVLAPAWSKTGNLAIVSRSGNRDTLTLGDQPVLTFDRIHEFKWVGARLFLLARRGQEEFLIADAGSPEQKSFLVARGLPSGEGDARDQNSSASSEFFFHPGETLSHALVVSKDGTRAACIVTNNGHSRVVSVRCWAKTPTFGAIFDSVADPQFVQGGRGLIYDAFRWDQGQTSLQQAIVVENRLSHFYEHVWPTATWQKSVVATATRYYWLGCALQ